MTERGHSPPCIGIGAAPANLSAAISCRGNHEADAYAPIGGAPTVMPSIDSGQCAVTTQSLTVEVPAPSNRESMSWRRCKSLIASDLYRYDGVISARHFWRHFFFTPGFRYSVVLRLARYSLMQRWARFGFRQFMSVMLYRYSVRYGICISSQTPVGAGLYIGHFGGIHVNAGSVIGNNCNIQQDVTLGKANRGEKAGAPVIGNNVFIGAGAKIIGRIHVGDGAAIGANAVVTRDVPAGAAVAGVPARVVSEQGSEGYVNRTNYPPIRD
jgi:serine O-acetyltransferase